MKPPNFITTLLALTLVVFATVGASCGSTPTKSLLVSEAFLNATGDQFVNGATEISKRCNAKDAAGNRTFAAPTTQKFCADFRAFEETKFKPAFAHAKSLWIIARKTNDAAMGDHSLAVIQGLIGEATAFLSQLNLTIGQSEPSGGPLTAPMSMLLLSVLPLGIGRRRIPVHTGVDGKWEVTDTGLKKLGLRPIEGGSAALAGIVPLLLQILPLIAQYGPSVVADFKRLWESVAASPTTPDEEKSLLDAAQAELEAVAERVANAPAPEP